MEGERLREEFWKKQNKLKMQQQRDLAGDAQTHRETLAGESRTHQEQLSKDRMAHQAGLATLSMVERQGQAEENRKVQREGQRLRKDELKARRDEIAARRKAQTAQAATKQVAEKEESERERRAKAEKRAKERSLATDDLGNEVIDWAKFDDLMEVWDARGKFPPPDQDHLGRYRGFNERRKNNTRRGLGQAVGIGLPDAAQGHDAALFTQSMEGKMKAARCVIRQAADLPPGTSPLSKLDLGPFEVHSMV